MANKNVADHIHRYKKVDLSRDKSKPYPVYRCIKPACTHYVPVQLSVGKVCECNSCHELMIISRRTLERSGGKPMTLPKCDRCVKKKSGPDTASAIAQFLSGK